MASGSSTPTSPTTRTSGRCRFHRPGPVSSATAVPLTTRATSPSKGWRSRRMAVARVRLGLDRPPGHLSYPGLRWRAGASHRADDGDDFMPSWSPDARELAYYGFRQGRRRLFVMSGRRGAGGRGDRRFGEPTLPRLVAGWAAARFHSDRTGRFELYAVERDSGGRWGVSRQITTDGGQDARWSPDGRSIVYVRSYGLWLVAPGGGPPRMLVTSSDPRRRTGTAPRAVGTRWADDLLQGAGCRGAYQPLGLSAGRWSAEAARALRRSLPSLLAGRVRDRRQARLLHDRRA